MRKSALKLATIAILGSTSVLAEIPAWASDQESPQAPALHEEPATNINEVLSGGISVIGIKAEFGKVTANILNRSLLQDTTYQRIEEEKKKKHYIRGIVSKITSVFGEVVSINASAASKDAAKTVLDETADWDDKDSQSLQQQQIIDELHPKITGAILQVAMGRGNQTQDANSQNICSRGFKELLLVSGPEAKEMVNDALSRWSKEATQGTKNIAPSDDLIASQKQIAILTEAAVQDDPVLIAIKTELQKFARPKKLPDRVNNTVQTILDSTAYMMPTPIIAAAVVAVKGVVVVNTGGPEEDKLQHLLVLAKRFSSRKAALNEEIHLAINARAIAAQSGNRLLGKCADALIDNLVTTKTLLRITNHELAAGIPQSLRIKE